MTISTSFAGVSGVKIEIDADNLKSTFLDTDLSSVSSSDDTIASAKAIKSYVDSSGPNVSISSAAFNTSTGVLTLTKRVLILTYRRFPLSVFLLITLGVLFL